MSEKITLRDIVKINKKLASKEYESQKEFSSYCDVIQEYIDETFFKNDAIIEKLVEYCENSARYLDITFKKASGIILSDENVHNYTSNIKRAIEKTIFMEERIFNFSIFVEIKSIFKYFLEKSKEYESLKNFKDSYSVSSIEFHQQNESFKYLYTIFDKLTYIAKHLKDKYYKKEPTKYSSDALRFSNDFLPNISFLAKSAQDFQKLSDIIERVTYSKAWHYIRRLRNSIEHDFVDPTYKYNICFSLELLFIIIGRILLALNKYLQSDEQIKETLESLRVEK
ncbi:hypothetical protein [Spiroplasma cantharicola]|uniref:Uncharacterized protein n=1 Tax=Spiroplasma cantharicola TaxID=362837 RepID=A0A0M4KE32_9MOLU|nr:hypothetical protein [Spiroplasma cantharicola]ALD66157.1 hypothetical protein SCANT_v1c02470 [Spiroplasma cantharicola]